MLALVLIFSFPLASYAVPATDIEILKSRLELKTEENPKTGVKKSMGTFAVFEDRDAQKGRMIHLNVLILHAKGPQFRPDPFFFFAGGPGSDVTNYVSMFSSHWIRRARCRPGQPAGYKR